MRPADAVAGFAPTKLRAGLAALDEIVGGALVSRVLRADFECIRAPRIPAAPRPPITQLIAA